MMILNTKKGSSFIWGSKDGVIKFENLIESKINYQKINYVEIEGANHAQFGDYESKKATMMH